jgi:RNA polymerase sigma factor (sigma-70 family)
MSSATQQVIAAAAGDARAFSGLVRRYQDFAFAAAYARTGDAEVAREVAQEALLEAWVQLPRLREPAAFGRWLGRIVSKRADRVTRRVRPREVALEAAPEGALSDAPGAAPDALTHDAALRARVAEAIAGLPGHERETVCLFYLSERPVSEVAASLGVKVGTVKKRLHSARARLKLDLEATMRETLNPERPSRDEALARAVRFFIAARVGDAGEVARLLAEDPSLAGATQPVIEDESHHYMATGAAARWTALHLAVNNGHLPVTLALLHGGAAPDAVSGIGLTPLHVAAGVQEVAITRALLASGAAPSPAAPRSGMTPLHTAAIRGDRDLTRALLDGGADPAARDAEGRTPADWAALSGHGELAAALGDSALPYPTGIKALDLLAPLPARGVVHLRGAHGVGMIVLLGELLHRHLARGGRAAFAALAERGHGEAEFPPILREMGLHEVTGRPGVSLHIGRLGDRSALAEAAASGATLIVADHALVRGAEAPEGALVIAFEGWEPRQDEVPAPPLPTPSATIVLSRALARAGLYPAVDPQESRSSVEIGARQAALAGATRAALAEGGPLAERLSAWLSQPFYVAEPFTGFPGASATLAQALEEAARLLDGELADAAPEALRYRPRLEAGETPRGL